MGVLLERETVSWERRTVGHLPRDVHDIVHLEVEFIVLTLAVVMKRHELGAVPLRVHLLFGVRALQGIPF